MGLPSLLLPLALVVAAPTADAGTVLSEVDAAARRAKDVTATMKLTIVEPAGARAERTLRIWQKGTDRRMAKFTAPARLRGVGLLARGDDALFLYLPAFGRVRRVVGRSRGDAFFGTDFSQDDMARLSYADRFTPTVAGSDEAHWLLRLDPKRPDDEPHHHLVLKARKADHVVAGIDFHDAADGPAVRRITASDVRAIGPQSIAHRIEAADLKTGRKTTAVLEQVQVDGGIEDGFFTKRVLKRSP